jgi:hypothetical protein
VGEEINAGAPKPGRPNMWDVLYAVDASTSMGEEAKTATGVPYVKIQAVKEGIQQVVKGFPFPYGSRVGVMGFRAPTKAMGMMIDSGKEMTQKVLPLTLVSDILARPDLLRDNLDTLNVGGATPTGEGLRAAVEMLHETQDGPRKRIKKVVLVTDDKSNVGPKPDAILDQKLIRMTMIDVVAIEKVSDRKVFEALVSRSGGKLTVVTSDTSLALALDPRIPYADPGAPNALLVEAERVAAVLKATDRKAPSYAGLAAAAGAVRERMEQKLQDTVSIEGQARADFDLALSAAMNDPKWPLMSMREFADRVWSRGAELAKLQTLEDRFRQAIRSLPA